MTLFSVLFGNPVALAGTAAAAASVPIIIHLLNRRRFKIVDWAAMRFLLAADKKSSRKLRIEQLLLLLLRIFILVLIALAMASVMGWMEDFWSKTLPQSFSKSTPSGRRAHRILVIDGSFSMGTKVGNSTYFENARKQALALVNRSGTGDAFSVIMMTNSAKRIVPRHSDNKKRVLDKLASMYLPHGNADLESTLEAVADLLRKSPSRYTQKEVYFFTDLQSATWEEPQTGRIRKALETINKYVRTAIVDVGGDVEGNLALTDIRVNMPVAVSKTNVTFGVTVQNYGMKSDKKLKIRFSMGRVHRTENGPTFDKREVETRDLFTSRGTWLESFSCRFPSAGRYVIQVEIFDDRWKLDNVRTAVLDGRDKVPVLIVNGKPAARPYDRSSEFLLDAIDPFQSQGGRKDHPFQATVLEASQFADAGRGDLSKYDCVFFCDVTQLSKAEVDRLKTHIKQRGGVVFCMGPSAAKNLKAYNDEMYRKDGTGLLPARLLGVQNAPAGYDYHFATETDTFTRPPLDVFTEGWQRATLQEVPFETFIRVEPLSNDIPYRAPRTILSFIEKRDDTEDLGETKPDNKRYPAILGWRPPLPAKHELPEESLVRQPGRGRVVLYTSTANREWTNWPRRPTYPWVMQELLRYATAGRLREQTYAIGQVLEDYLLGQGGDDVVFVLPNGRREETKTIDAGDFAILRYVDSDQSGIYLATVGDSKRVYPFAVNVPTRTASQTNSESNPKRITKEEIKSQYDGWDYQIIKKTEEATQDKSKMPTAPETGVPQISELGTAVAHKLLLIALILIILEVILAFIFGHYSAVHEKQMAGMATAKRPYEKWLRIGIITAMCLIAVMTTFLAFTLIHDAITGDFLGYAPGGARASAERALGIPEPAPGESTKWDLEYLSYFVSKDADPWLAIFIGLAVGVLVVLIYNSERRIASQPGTVVTNDGVQQEQKPNRNLGSFFLFVGLRMILVIAMLAVLLPQIRLFFKRTSWPHVVILIDDSTSMSTVDNYRDPKVKEFAEKLAVEGKLTEAQRLALAQTLLTRHGTDWITELLTQRKVKVHVYHCSSRAERITSVTTQSEIPNAIKAIQDLKASPKNDISKLGTALRQVINDFEGHSLAGVIMLTDGVTTEGVTVSDVSRFARKNHIPLFFVGIGDSLERRDIELSDLKVADSVLVNDKLVFQFNVKVKGYGGDPNVPDIKVRLYEKGKARPLNEVSVTPDLDGKPVEVRLEHQPKTPGEKIFIIKTDVRKEEVDKHNNELGPRRVYVHEAKLIKVLYVAGYGRWEMRYLKALLERESERAVNKKSIDLSLVLIDSDAEFAKQDRSARKLQGLPTKAQLNKFDVVILGDVNPDPNVDAVNRLPHVTELMKKMPDFLKDLSEFVMNRGGGLVVMAGERYSPHAYRDTPLANILPIEMIEDRQPSEPAGGYVTPYRPELTAIGKRHPIFSFNTQDNMSIWDKLQPLYWASEGYKLKPAAEVLAVHPTKKAAEDNRDERHPLVVHQFVGAGRCLFLGINETWRWRFREYEQRYNEFWIQTIRYLSRSRSGRVTLTLDKQVPYRRGEAITITVRFPDDSPPPPKTTQVRVKLHRKATKTNEQERRTIKLQHVEGSRGTYTGALTRTPEGRYRFWLDTPKVKGAVPETECLVLAPPGELELLRMNEDDMKQAARESRGRFYSLVDAHNVLKDLPAAERISISAPGPPFTVWNQWWMFVFVLLLMTTEWILRKLRHLL